MVGMGQHLQSLSALADGEFRELLHLVGCLHFSHLVQHIEDILTTEGYSPQAWAHDLEGRIRAIRQQLTGCYLPPKDMANTADPVRSLRYIMKAFGELMVAWPSILKKAVVLAAQGVTVGRSVLGHSSW
jgi:hypothetical protein